MSWISSVIGLARDVLGTGVNIYASGKAAKTQEELYYKQAAFKKEQAEFAAREGRRQAELLKRQRAERVEARRLELARILGAQRARYWASGVTLQGTPLLVAMESQARAEEDISRLKYWFGQDIETAELQSHMLSRGLFKEASYLRAAARATKFAGVMGALSSGLSAGSTTFQGIQSAYGQQYAQQGAYQSGYASGYQQAYSSYGGGAVGTGASTAGSAGRPY